MTSAFRTGLPPAAGGYSQLSRAWPPRAQPDHAQTAARAVYPVAARALTKVFPAKGRKGEPKTAVAGLDLTVGAGAIFGLLGPNGSGKTTTIDMLTGLSRPTSGTVTIFGLLPGSQGAKRLIGVVSQETAAYKKLTARQNLLTHAMLYGFAGAEARRRTDAALEVADLREHAGERVSVFSGGMARRLQIAKNLLHGPQVLFMDEPTLGVDPTQRTALETTIQQLSSSGVAVLLTTNVLDEAARLCGRVAIIDHGRLVAEDEPRLLQRKYGHVIITARVAAAASACEAALQGALMIPGVRSAAGHPVSGAEADLVITTDTDKGTTGLVIAALTRTDDLSIIDIETGLPALDEVFGQLTGPHRIIR